LPDLTIILDVPTEVAQARVVPKYRSLFGDASADGDKDRIERRPESYHRQVRQNFLDLAERRPERHAVVDASATVDVVAERVRAAIAERLSG
jgi:dTMP kinase